MTHCTYMRLKENPGMYKTLYTKKESES